VHFSLANECVKRNGQTKSDCLPISRSIDKKVQDRTKVTVDH